MSVARPKKSDGLPAPSSRYRATLLARRSQLVSQLHSSSGRLAEVGRVGEDQARVLDDQFVILRLNRVTYEQLKHIEAALARLDAGEYGICIDCDKPIAPKRLEAVPWAIRCVFCQDRLGPGSRPGDSSPVAA